MLNITPTKENFLKLAKKGNLLPVFTEISGDIDTPVSAYFKMALDQKFSFLLESVEGEEKIARYSFLATDPELLIRSKNKIIEILKIKNNRLSKWKSISNRSPLDVIQKIMSRYRFVETPQLPRFCGGMVGYLGYDLVRHFEKLPNKPQDDLDLPELLLVLAKNLLIFDHVNHKLIFVRCVFVEPNLSKNAKMKRYLQAVAELNKSVAKIQKPLKMNKIILSPQGKDAKSTLRSNFTKAAFKGIVLKAKKCISQGDIIQVVLSQRLEVDLNLPPIHVYRALRALNPSPYMYILNFDRLQIIGSSPELLVRCDQGIVETRPIAGTRPRGRNEKEDIALAKNLLNDPKEKAEHIMLVDLGRNDLGRVCQQGSIHLSEFMKIEKYSHVMHIVSNVRGKLRSNKTNFDVLQAAFPAGTVSGAPKVRAMEIIDELENVARGPYAGCIGYFSFSGNLDSCITIRTIVAYNGKAYIQAGAGIVADSQPQKEYQETLNKAMAQIKAIEKAHINMGDNP